jgi:hypothetical protein
MKTQRRIGRTGRPLFLNFARPPFHKTLLHSSTIASILFFARTHQPPLNSTDHRRSALAASRALQLPLL